MRVAFEILGCLVVSFFFSGIEAGILSLNRIRLRHRVKSRDPAALVLHKLLADPERVLTTVLVVTNLMQIVALTLGVQWAAHWFGDGGYWMVLLVALPVWVLGVELLPKSLFRRFPYRALAAFSYVLNAVHLLLRPFLSGAMRLVQLLFLRRPVKKVRVFGGREDFKYLTFESERQGYISKDERAVIQAVLDFRQMRALDVMVPLDQAAAVRGSLPLSSARLLARERGVDRLPVLGDDGRVSGLLDLHELAIQAEWHGAVEIFQRRIVRSEVNEPLYSIMRKLRAARLPMASVRDASGASVGVVLWDDIVRLLLMPSDDKAAAFHFPSPEGLGEES